MRLALRALALGLTSRFFPRAKIEAQFDRAPTKRTIEGAPRSFKRFQALLESAKATGARAKPSALAASAVDSNRNGAGKAKANGTSAKTTKVPTLRPNESLQSYNRRVDEAFREEIDAETRKTRNVSTKRKEYLKARHAKMAARRKGKANDDDGDDEDDVEARVLARTKATMPKFGEVAEDIPHFTVRPKVKASKLAQVAAAVERSRQDGDDGDNDDDRKAQPRRRALYGGSEAKDSSLPKKTKLKDMSPAEKRQLEAERDRVINQYRQLKAVQMLRGGAPS